MGVTSLLPILMGNVITYELQVRTHTTVATLINNVTLPFNFHSAVDIIHQGNGGKAIVDFSKRVGSLKNHCTIYFFRCWDFILIRVQLDRLLQITLVNSSNTLAALKSRNAVSNKCFLASNLASVFV